MVLAISSETVSFNVARRSDLEPSLVWFCKSNDIQTTEEGQYSAGIKKLCEHDT